MGKKLNSLRFRLTVTFIGLILLFIMAMWATNDRFLEIYYQNYKVSLLQDAYTRIDEAVRKADEKSKTQAAGEAGAGKTDEAENPAGTSGKTEISATGAAGIIDDEELAETVQQLRDTSNITVLIYDSMRGETLVSSTTDARMLQERVQRYILGQFPPQIETILETDNYRIQKSSDRRNQQAFLESWGYFTDNGTVFIMSVPMDSIREAAWISNRFLMYVGLIVAAIGAFLVYLITKYVTKPVNELSALSERMSRLDFDAKYTSTGHAATEIETLGNSIRHNRVRETEVFRKFLTPRNFYRRLPGAWGYGARLPYDQSDLVATLAPRAILLVNTVNDYNDGAEADALGLEIAKSVYRNLGLDADSLVKFNYRSVQDGDPHGTDDAQRQRTAEYMRAFFFGEAMSPETDALLNTNPFLLPVSGGASPFDTYYGGFNTITGGTSGTDGRDGWYYRTWGK